MKNRFARAGRRVILLAEWSHAFSLVSLLGVLATLLSPHGARAVTIRQLQEVEEGGSGWFEVEWSLDEIQLPLRLRLSPTGSPGSATFADHSLELIVSKSGRFEVKGIVATDPPGGMTLSAWPGGTLHSAVTYFFDVLPPTPAPRIYRDGQDITETVQEVVVGQQINLNVVLHPGLKVESQRWSIGTAGEYVGGFLHRPREGGPQPTVLRGPSTRFYWVSAGDRRKITYQILLANGDVRTASAFFDVDGPSSTQVDVQPIKVVVGSGAVPNSSVLGLVGSGITFHAGYFLPEGLLRNFTWVQLILFDSLMVKSSGETMYCVPKAEPLAQQGAGLDTDYPYDTHNPTRDNPPLQLTPDAAEFSRTFHARMYLLWTSGLSNSIAVPLGFVDWHFSAHAIRQETGANDWIVQAGSGGPNDPVKPFTRSSSYPQWNSLVPYSGVLSCN